MGLISRFKKFYEGIFAGAGRDNIYPVLDYEDIYQNASLGQGIVDPAQFFYDVTGLRNLSRQLFWFNSHYRGIVRQYVKYVAGKVPVIESESDQDNDRWSKFSLPGRKKKRFSRFFKEWVRRFFRDGETFIYVPSLSFIKPENVIDPGGYSGGIKYEEGVEIAYCVKKNLSLSWIDASEIIHTDAEDDDVPRGIPYLIAIMSRAKDYEALQDSRILLNRIRASVAMIRKHNASGTKVKSFADAKSDDTSKQDVYGEYKRQAYVRPGAVIDTTANTEYSFLSPNVNASDVADDLRNLRLCFSAATGLPEFIVTGDASNSNYASTMVAEGPGEREIQDWQDFFAEEICELWQKVVGNFEDEPEIRFAPVITRRTAEETARNNALFDKGVISIEEWRRREGVDSDKMEKEINARF